MWPWLLAKLPKRFGVLGTLWLISGAVHGLILLGALLLGGVTDSRQSLVVSSARRQTDARIVLLPMHKTVRGTQFDQPVRGAKFASAATRKPSANPMAPQIKKAVKPAAKKPAKFAEKKATNTTLANAAKDKKTEKKLDKKIKPVPKPPQQKLVAKTPEKKLEEKKVPEPEPLVAKAESPDEAKPVAEEKNELVAGDPNATQDVIYVGRDDLREMQTQNVVADSIQKHWQSPSGIPQDTLCQIIFDVDAEGKACNIVMKQKSKVLVFDIRARASIVLAHFSPAAQGQQFTVAFKP